MAQTKKPTEKEVVYETLILRRDGQHIVAIQSTEFEKCYQKWEALHTQWQECAKEVKPFIVKDPILTAFEPGLIYEILLQPVMTATKAIVNENNPYAKEMLNRGFSNTFGNQDLLSRASNSEY